MPRIVVTMLFIMFMQMATALWGEEITILTINGNAIEPEVTFGQPAIDAQVRIQRSSASLPITLTLEIGLPAGQTASPPQATAGVDYQLLIGNPPVDVSSRLAAATPTSGQSVSITIPAGSLSWPILVHPLDDTLMEGAEQILIRPQPNAGYVINDPGSASVFITDAETAVSITAIDPRADERLLLNTTQSATGTYGYFGISFAEVPGRSDLTGNGYPGARSLTLDVSGTAINGIDYWLLGSLTAPGAFVATPSNAVMNGAAQGATTLSVWTSNGVAPGMIIWINGQSTNYFITAVTPSVCPTATTPFVPTTISITPPLQQGVPGGAPWPGQVIDRCAIPTVGASGAPIVVVGQTFAATSNVNTITNIPETQLNFYIWVIPIDDLLVEGSESVQLNVRANYDYIVQSPGQATVNVADDEAVMSIARISDATEAGASGVCRIVSSAAFTRDIFVPYSVGGTATPGTDYGALSGIAKLRSGETSVDIQINATEDNSPEAAETVVVTLADSLDYALQTSGSTSANPSATMLILDRSAAAVLIGTLALVAVDPTATETDGQVTDAGLVMARFTRNQAESTDTNGNGRQDTFIDDVDVSTPVIGGTAVPGTDVQVQTSNLRFLRLTVGSRTQITPAGALVQLSTAGGGTTALPSGTELLVGGGAMSPVITAVRMVVLESASVGPATTAVRVAATTGIVNVDPGDAAADSIFISGYPIIVSPVDDLAVEPTKTVVLSLPTGPSYVMDPNAVTASVAIFDDEPVVSVSGTTGNPGTFTISYPGVPAGKALMRDLVVSILMGGAAQNGIDYIFVPTTVTIPAYSRSATISITPLADNEIDPGESVTVTLVDDGGPGAGRYDVGTGTASLIIVDDLPEIDVQRAGVSLADGGADAVAEATLAGTAINLTYTVRNIGASTLTLGTLIVNPTPGTCTVTTVEGLPSTLAAGSSANLVLRTTPLLNGTWSFTWSVGTNDRNEDPFNLRVTGFAGPRTEIEVSRLGVSVPDGSTDNVPGTTAYASTVVTYDIANAGFIELVLGQVILSAIENCDAEIQIQPAQSVAVGGTTRLVIRITPRNGARWHLAWTMSTNDLDENPTEVVVTGSSAPFIPAFQGASSGGCGTGSVAGLMVLAALAFIRRRAR